MFGPVVGPGLEYFVESGGGLDSVDALFPVVDGAVEAEWELVVSAGLADWVSVVVDGLEADEVGEGVGYALDGFADGFEDVVFAA